MPSDLRWFESVVRRAHGLAYAPGAAQSREHPFEERNIHPSLPSKVRELFDDGHYSQASFEAFKFLDKEVQTLAASDDFGFKLMMAAFGGDSPVVALNALKNASDKDEQKGFQFLFAGSVLAIRNPRGHEVDVTDDPGTCLDHLAFASLLLRRLSTAGQPRNR